MKRARICSEKKNRFRAEIVMPVSVDTYQIIKIIVVCILSYGASFFLKTNEFVYDDGVAVVQNDDVTNTNRTIFDSINSILKHDFWGQNISDDRSHKSYRPIVTLMFHMEYRFFNTPNLAALMKRINLLVHIGICCIVYNIMRHVLRDCHYSSISNAVLLFAAHPIHTEVICSVVGRSDLLCAFFFFSTIGLYLEIIDEHEKFGQVNWQKMVILFDAAFVSLFCKEVGIMVLPLCIVYDVLMNIKLSKIGRRDMNRRFELLRKACYNVGVRGSLLLLQILALALLRSFCSRYKFPKFSSQENPMAAHPSQFVRFFSSMYVQALNMWLLLCPDWLCCDWSHNSFELIETWSDHRIIFAVIVYIFMARTFLTGPRHIRIAIAFLIVPFLPSSHLISVGFVVADRVLYIPSLGFCLLIAFGIQAMLPKCSKIIRILYVMLLIVFIIRSNERTIDWQNNLNLFTSAIRVCPSNAKIHYNLAQIYALNGNYNKSLEFNLIANELNPNNVGIRTNLGNAYRHVGNFQAAIEQHQAVIDIDPKYPFGWMNLGISYVENGLYEHALAAYLKADELKPNNAKIVFNLGNLYLRMGNLTMAEYMYRRGVKLDPRSHRAHINLIVYLSEHGTLDELLEAIDEANFHMYDNVPVLLAIAKVLTKVDFNFEKIEKLYHRVLEIQPNNVVAHEKLATEYLKRNQSKMALKHLKKSRNQR